MIKNGIINLSVVYAVVLVIASMCSIYYLYYSVLAAVILVICFTLIV
jgi:hypothetical protein